MTAKLFIMVYNPEILFEPLRKVRTYERSVTVQEKTICEVPFIGPPVGILVVDMFCCKQIH